jgi:hypothetical protein
MSANRKAIKREDLLKALKELEKLMDVPPEPKAIVTAGEAVRELDPILRKLCRKGYSAKNLSERLEKLGVAVGSSTLKTYLRQNKSSAHPVAKKAGNCEEHQSEPGSAAPATPATPKSAAQSPVAAEVKSLSQKP